MVDDADGEQVEVLLRLPHGAREHVAQLAACRSRTRRTARRSSCAVADIVPVVNPVVIKRQDLQRREAIYAGTQGRPTGDVGADVQKIVKATTQPPGYRFDVGGRPRSRRRPSRAWSGALRSR